MVESIKLSTARATQSNGSRNSLRVLVVSMICALATGAFVYFYILPAQQAAVSTPSNPVETTQQPR
jgi:hypothetical protein